VGYAGIGGMGKIEQRMKMSARLHLMTASILVVVALIIIADTQNICTLL
jgi:hypothetical protein